MAEKREASPRPFLPDRPQISLPQPGFLSSLLFYTALVALGGLGAFGCVITAFGLPAEPLPLALFGGVFSLASALAWLSARWRRLAVPGGLAVWGVVVWRAALPLENGSPSALAYGAARTLNILLAAYEERLNMSLPRIDLPAGVWVERSASVTLFLLAVLFPFLWCLGGALIRRGGGLGAFCLTGALLLTALAFSIVPAPWTIGALLLFWGFLLLAAPSSRRQEKDRGQGWVRAPSRFARPSSLLLLLPLALLLWGLYRFYPVSEYSRPAVADQIREGISQGARLPALFRGGVGSGGNTVDLRDLGGRSFTGKTVLRTRHEFPLGRDGLGNSPTRLKDYLKSYVGSVYTGDRWELLSAEDRDPLEEALGGQRAQTLPADLAQGVPSAEDLRCPYTLSVRKVDVDPRAVYAPYGLYGPEEAFQDMAFEADGYLRSQHWFTGPQEYVFPAAALPENGCWMFNRFFYAYRDSGAEAAYPLADELYRDFLSAAGNGLSAGAYDLWAVPQEALDAYAAYSAAPAAAREGAALIRQTEAYTRFVYDRYTQLPEGTLAFAQGYLRDHGFATALPAGDRVAILRRVRDLIQQECAYSLSPAALPAGRDMAEFFLTESREGFCVHFATAAVVLLRAEGIPCRYAEGYAVPVDQAGGWVDVPDYNAHAWVEVYWGGLGWVPFEVTPAGPDAPAAYANAIGPSTQEELGPSPTASPTPTPSAAPSASPSPTPSAGPNQGATPAPTPDLAARRAQESRQAFLTFLVILMGIAAPFLLTALSRRLRLLVRRRLFRQRDRNKAALRVYAHLLRLYRENDALPYGGFYPPAEAEQIALKARFSQHQVTQEELDQLLDLAQRLESRLDQRLGPWDRLRCRYFLALF